MRIEEAIKAVYRYRGMDVEVTRIKKGSTESRAHTQRSNDPMSLYSKEQTNGRKESRNL